MGMNLLESVLPQKLDQEVEELDIEREEASLMNLNKNLIKNLKLKPSQKTKDFQKREIIVQEEENHLLQHQTQNKLINTKCFVKSFSMQFWNLLSLNTVENLALGNFDQKD